MRFSWARAVILTVVFAFGMTFLAVLLAPLNLSSMRVREAKEPPADLCSVLSPDEIAKAIGTAVNPPDKSPAAKGTGKEVAGSNCKYESKKSGAGDVTLIIYVDPSVAVAKETFNKFRVFFGVSTAVSGIGDSAYIDEQHAIHVVKDKVRYYIQISSEKGTSTDKQVKDLATTVASHL